MAVYTYDYDFSYSPAAPVVQIEVGSSLSEQTHGLTAMVDSGSDATLLPQALLRQLRARRVDTRILRTVTGIRTSVSLYHVSVQIGPYTLHNVHAVGNRDAEGAVLGRDVLNHLVVTLNGLAAVSEISQ